MTHDLAKALVIITVMCIAIPALPIATIHLLEWMP